MKRANAFRRSEKKCFLNNNKKNPYRRGNDIFSSVPRAISTRRYHTKKKKKRDLALLDPFSFIASSVFVTENVITRKILQIYQAGRRIL